MLKSLLRNKSVEFFCANEDYGVIPEPYPARKLMPDWFKNLAPKIGGRDALENSTIKRCPPFLDAMTTGWIIPLAADVEFYLRDDGGIQSKSLFYKKMVETHSQEQIDGHPSLPSQPWKWINHILIKIPPKHSALFVPPLNRADERFECISGMVDAGYMGNDALEYINFPFFFKQPNWTGTIKAGTPLVQIIVIPWNELTFSKKTNFKAITKKEVDLVERTRRRRASHESYYRDQLWEKNK